MLPREKKKTRVVAVHRRPLGRTRGLVPHVTMVNTALLCGTLARVGGNPQARAQLRPGSSRGRQSDEGG